MKWQVPGPVVESSETVPPAGGDLAHQQEDAGGVEPEVAAVQEGGAESWDKEDDEEGESVDDEVVDGESRNGWRVRDLVMSQWIVS